LADDHRGGGRCGARRSALPGCGARGIRPTLRAAVARARHRGRAAPRRGAYPASGRRCRRPPHCRSRGRRCGSRIPDRSATRCAAFGGVPRFGKACRRDAVGSSRWQGEANGSRLTGPHDQRIEFTARRDQAVRHQGPTWRRFTSTGERQVECALLAVWAYQGEAKSVLAWTRRTRRRIVHSDKDNNAPLWPALNVDTHTPYWRGIPQGNQARVRRCLREPALRNGWLGKCRRGQEHRKQRRRQPKH
jgi:hypothetical protein